MPTYTTFLYYILVTLQLYAFAYHFPPPKTGIVNPTNLNALKFLTATAALLSFIPLTTFSSHHNVSILSPLLTPLGLSLLLVGEILFVWTATITKPQTLPVIFSRVTPSRVITTGPFAFVRHPAYVSYASGWMGVALLVAGRCGLSSTWSIGVYGCVGGLCWLYAQGADLEEKQFLKGEDVVGGQAVSGKVVEGYREYMRRVKDRWVPGVF